LEVRAVRSVLIGLDWLAALTGSIIRMPVQDADLVEAVEVP